MTLTRHAPLTASPMRSCCWLTICLQGLARTSTSYSVGRDTAGGDSAPDCCGEAALALCCSTATHLQTGVCIHHTRLSACKRATYSEVQTPSSCCAANLKLTRTAQDARLILTAPEPALAECLIPPSAALAYEAHMRSSDTGAAAASWDLAAAPPRVRARDQGL